jgi:hypothetical protein
VRTLHLVANTTKFSTGSYAVLFTHTITRKSTGDPKLFGLALVTEFF